MKAILTEWKVNKPKSFHPVYTGYDIWIILCNTVSKGRITDNGFGAYILEYFNADKTTQHVGIYAKATWSLDHLAEELRLWIGDV